MLTLPNTAQLSRLGELDDRSKYRNYLNEVQGGGAETLMGHESCCVDAARVSGGLSLEISRNYLPY